MFDYIQAALHPERFHGFGKQPPFFEGWYYKLVNAAEEYRFAIIPGVFLSANPSEEHAFVQVLDGLTGHATYHTYPMRKFWAARDRFDVRIGPNRFTSDYVALDIATPERTIVGTVRFIDTKPWPVTMASPGIMGWYGWLPFMETYHGVVSLDHELRGTLEIDDSQIDFSDGRGYIEKDWGKSFPSAYIWIQTNHFDAPGTSLTASAAVVPWGQSAYRGFIVGLWHTGKLYRFATYTGAKETRLEVEDDCLRWALADQRYRLEIRAQRASGGLLHAPTRTEMHRRVNETMQAMVTARLCTMDGEVLFEGAGRNAGMEVHGDLDRLLAM